MTFDPQAYAAIAATNPQAAAQYLAAFTPAATPAVTPTPTPAAQPSIHTNPAALAQPTQVAARGTLEDFFNQPTGGGGPSVTSKFFNKRPQESWLRFTVLADVTNSDVQHQKTPQGVLQYFKKNGQDDLTRPKLVLVVKVMVTGSSDGTHVAEFPDGMASLWLKKGPVTDDLVRAMTAAGDPSGYPKAGADMVMQSAGEQASRTVGFSATKLYRFQYAGPVAAAAEAIANPTTAAAPAASPTVASAAPTIAPVTPAPAPAPAAPQIGAVTPPAVPEATFTPPPAPTVGADSAELLARLRGE